MFHLIFELFWYFALISGIYHMTRTESLGKTLLFFGSSFIWGYLIEYFGLLWYNMYYYPQNYFLTFQGVPLTIAAGWSAIIYFGLIMVKMINSGKISKLKSGVEIAAVSTAIDVLILEPLALFYRFWTWTQNNFWFGAPLLNFVGWFLAISFYVTIYNFVDSKKISLEKKTVMLLFWLSVGMIVIQFIGRLYLLIFGAF